MLFNASARRLHRRLLHAAADRLTGAQQRFKTTITKRTLPMSPHCSLILDLGDERFSNIQLFSAWQDCIDIIEVCDSGEEASSFCHTTPVLDDWAEVSARAVSFDCSHADPAEVHYTVEHDVDENQAVVYVADTTATQAAPSAPVSTGSSASGSRGGRGGARRLLVRLPEICDSIVVSARSGLLLQTKHKIQANNLFVTCEDPAAPAAVTGACEGELLAAERASRTRIVFHDKVRAMSVNIQAQAGLLSSRKALEGNNVYMQAGRVKCKLVHADHLTVKTDAATTANATAIAAEGAEGSEPNISIDSLYCSKAFLTSTAAGGADGAHDKGGGVTIGQTHGDVQVFASSGNIKVGSCNGLLRAEAALGDVKFHLQQLSRAPSSPAAARSSCHILAPLGAIEGSLAKEIVDQLRLSCTVDATTDEGSAAAGASARSNISIDATSLQFTAFSEDTVGSTPTNSISGVLCNRVDESAGSAGGAGSAGALNSPKAFGGKINTAAASNYAMNRFVETVKAGSVSGSGAGGPSGEEVDRYRPLRPEDFSADGKLIARSAPAAPAPTAGSSSQGLGLGQASVRHTAASAASLPSIDLQARDGIRLLASESWKDSILKKYHAREAQAGGGTRT